MLVLSRKVGEELVIGDNIRIVINRVAGNRVAVAIEAPDDVSIVRGELKTLRDEFSSAGAEADGSVADGSFAEDSVVGGSEKHHTVTPGSRTRSRPERLAASFRSAR